jgi:two-component system chemotaxis response regulator CheY
MLGFQMQSLVPKHLEQRFGTISVLIVDDDHHMRKVVRTMLMAIGVKRIHEAGDGPSGLEVIRQQSPDVVLVDWEMPGMDGPQFVTHVRQPGAFPMPDVPIIMLTGHGDRWRVVEAARVGVHEYLLKPVSTKSLMDRIAAVLLRPRQIVQMDGYYGPAPRKLVVVPDEPVVEANGNVILLN